MAVFKRWSEVGDEQKAAGIVGYNVPDKPGPEYYKRLRRELQEWREADAEGIASRRALFIANNSWMTEGVLAEEERYAKRLARANRLFEKFVKPIDIDGKIIIIGEEAFFLHDTHGIIIEELRQTAAERGMTIDEEGFEQAMEKQRQQSRPEKAGLARWSDVKV